MKQKEEFYANELDNITVSYSHNTHNPYLTQTSLGNILNRIKEDQELERIVSATRSESDKDKRRSLKEENLPYFVLGTFENNHRRSDNLISTQFISIDFDDLNGRSDELDEKLKADENVFTFFKSPSNNRKVIYKLDKPITDRREYSNAYSYFLNELNSRYGIEADKQTSDAARAIFLSYDPDLYINENAKPLFTDEVPEPEPVTDTINIQDIAEEELRHLPTAVLFLKSVKLSYEEWIKCGLALTQLGEKGRGYFVYLSINNYYNDSLEEINRKYDNLLETTEGKITLATLFGIAIDHGYDYYEDEEETAVEERDFTAELKERFLVDDNRDPNKLLGRTRHFNLTSYVELSLAPHNVDRQHPAFNKLFIQTEAVPKQQALLAYSPISRGRRPPHLCSAPPDA